MGEQPRRLDDIEAGVGEVCDHVAGPSDGEEAVLCAPDQLDGNIDLSVQPAEVAYVLVVEAPQ